MIVFGKLLGKVGLTSGKLLGKVGLIDLGKLLGKVGLTWDLIGMSLGFLLMLVKRCHKPSIF